MTGIKVLPAKEFENFFDKKEFTLKAEDLPGFDFDSSHTGVDQLQFYMVKDVMIIATPINASQLGPLIDSIGKLPAAMPRQILVGLRGHGATEGHIVTAFWNNGEVQIFDSKVSSAKRFFAENPGALNKIGNLLFSLFRALLPNPKQKVNIAIEGGSIKAQYDSLGTQSFFDPATCGYHTAATMKICANLIEKGEDVNRQNILKHTKNPFAEGRSKIQKNKHTIGFASFVKKAWQDTVMPLNSIEERKQLRFRNYFLWNPLNFIRRPIEFVFNFTSEVFSFSANRIMTWAPKNVIAQYARSALLLASFVGQGVAKVGYLLLRTITSPLTNFIIIGKKLNILRKSSKKENKELNSNAIDDFCDLGDRECNVFIPNNNNQNQDSSSIKNNGQDNKPQIFPQLFTEKKGDDPIKGKKHKRSLSL